MKLKMEMVQLRETVLKQQQSHTCAAHTELQQNTEHQTQRLTALTQQMRTLQTEKDSYQCELTALRLQLQDREQSTLEMRQQLREIQEEREEREQRDPGPERAAKRDTRGERGERTAEQWDPGPERAAERTPSGQRRTSTDPQSSNTALHPKVT